MKKSKKAITVGGETYQLRIYSKFYKTMKEMLPEDEGIAAIVINVTQDPVKYAVPFLWGIMQDRASDTERPVEDAYDLFDTLVDEKKTAGDIAEIVYDICENSGFFDRSAAVIAARSIEAIQNVAEKATETAAEALKILPLDESLTLANAPATPTGSNPTNTGVSLTESAKTTSTE